ncbi:glutaredoxin domain-containing protein [Metabacillus sp. RGM 3146]|uniref:glutaredoxin domain-containing protein n=1 Tax=Metabacillus sp. RGM 3146 TaxID=3401092 RepID=UPI003B9CF158
MKKVTVYTQNECPPCKIVKQFLDHHQIAFEEINITENSKARDFLINQLKSYSTPTVAVDNAIVKGFDIKTLEQLLGIQN